MATAVLFLALFLETFHLLRSIRIDLQEAMSQLTDDDAFQDNETDSETDSETDNKTGCDAFKFLKFNYGSGGVGSGGLRKKAARKCEEHTWMNTPMLAERNWIRSVCKDGAYMGREICTQSTAEPGENEVAPYDLIDHWEEHQDRHGKARSIYDDVKNEWCKAKPKPKWTGFANCWHVCQVKYIDCDQWDTCKVCESSREKKDEICDGVRDKVYYKGREGSPPYDFGVTPIKEYSFLQACWQGCQWYVQMKRSHEGGKDPSGKKWAAAHPACTGGGRMSLLMTRQQLKSAWEKSCTEGGGERDRSGQVCLCDRSAGSECVNGDDERSEPGRGAVGCLENHAVHKSGYMKDCEGCRCEEEEDEEDED